jgi:hypothetical protein
LWVIHRVIKNIIDMKTRKSVRKTPHKIASSKHRHPSSSRPSFEGEFAAEEHWINQLMPDEEVRPVRKSKGADEEG